MRWTFLYCCIIASVLNASWLFAVTDHDSSEIRCLNCHVTLPFEGVILLFHTDTSAICLNCHSSYPCKSQAGEKAFAHPVAVVPSFKIPPDMPLDLEKGKDGASGEPGVVSIPAVDQPEERADTNRFVDNSDGTITDRATGLMWLIDASCLV